MRKKAVRIRKRNKRGHNDSLCPRALPWSLAMMVMLFVFFFASASAHACTNPAGMHGDIVFNDDDNVPQVCTYFGWVALGMPNPGAGSGGCGSPSGVAGDVIYNETAKVPQYCDGADWVEMMGQIGTGDPGVMSCPSCDPHHALTGGGNAACAVRNNGVAYCWGGASGGRVGIGIFTDIVLFPSVPIATKSPPAADPVTGTHWMMTRQGTHHGCGLRNDGTAYCWGQSHYGELGDGEDTNWPYPVKVDDSAISGARWVYVGSSGDDHNCGIRDNGQAYCWGRGTYNRLGYGGTSQQNTPVQVSTSGVSGSAWTVIGAARRHSCGLRDNGTIWCWGWGDSGAVGDNNLSNHEASTPSEVLTTGVSGSSWVLLTTGHRHNCAMRDDDSLWCWGWNDHGQLGIGNTTSQGIPQEVDDGAVSGTKWVYVNASTPEDSNTGSGTGHTCGIRDDGTAWCWGLNGDGQLGVGDEINKSVPTAVVTSNLTGSSWTTISLGHRNTCGMRDDRTIWCWGRAAHGVHADGTTSSSTNKTVPENPVQAYGGLFGTAWGYEP